MGIVVIGLHVRKVSPFISLGSLETCTDNFSSRLFKYFKALLDKVNIEDPSDTIMRLPIKSVITVITAVLKMLVNLSHSNGKTSGSSVLKNTYWSSFQCCVAESWEITTVSLETASILSLTRFPRISSRMDATI